MGSSGKTKFKTGQYFQDWPKWLSRFYSWLIGLSMILVGFFIWLGMIHYRLKFQGDSLPGGLAFPQVATFLIATTVIGGIISVLLAEVFQLVLILVQRGRWSLRDWMIFIHLNVIWLSIIGVSKVLEIFFHYHLTYPADEYAEEFYGCIFSGLGVALVGLRFVFWVTDKYFNQRNKYPK